MEIIDPADEFSPLEGDRLDFLLTICSHLEGLSENDWLSNDDQEYIKLARHHMMVLMAQGMAGYELFKTTNSLSRDLYEDIQSLCREHQVMSIPKSVVRYEKYLADGPLFNCDDV